MQKFGLDSVLERAHRYDEFRDLELDLLREQSSALGRAGRKLQESIVLFQKESKSRFKKKSEKEHLQEIGNNFHALMIQRELTGFIDSNVDWIKKFYDIPDEAFQFSGVYPSK